MVPDGPLHRRGPTSGTIKPPRMGAHFEKGEQRGALSNALNDYARLVFQGVLAPIPIPGYKTCTVHKGNVLYVWAVNERENPVGTLVNYSKMYGPIIICP